MGYRYEEFKKKQMWESELSKRNSEVKKNKLSEFLENLRKEISEEMPARLKIENIDGVLIIEGKNRFIDDKPNNYIPFEMV